MFNSYSNGGSDWGSCSANSDRSQCIDNTNTAINSQFAPSYNNEKTEREGVTITCLDSAALGGSLGSKSGDYGETCNKEGTKAGKYPQASWDGIRSTTDYNTLIGGLKNKHPLSHYTQCSWCPENLNCIFHNAYFPFFFGYLQDCPFGEYSANGDLDCHRKTADKLYFKLIYLNFNSWINFFEDFNFTI